MRRRKTQAVTLRQIDLGIKENHSREAELLGKSHQTLENYRPLSWMSLVSDIFGAMSSMSR